MKLVVFIVEGVINTGLKLRVREHDAGLAACHALGYEVTEESYNEFYNEMKLARADAPAEAALWQIIVTSALMRGWDDQRREIAWHELLNEYRGRAGYAFVEMPGARELLEELKFGSVDNWGDVPVLVAITTGGSMALDALEQAKLAPLFDQVISLEALGMRVSDPRIFADLLHEHGVPANHAVCVGSDLPRGLSAARLAGMEAMLFRGADDDSLHARGPWEMPAVEANDVPELGDALVAWLSAPPPISRRSRPVPSVRPSARANPLAADEGLLSDLEGIDDLGSDDSFPSEDPTGPRTSSE